MQSNMHSIFDLGPRPARKDSNVPQIKSSYELTVLIYTVRGAVREIPSHQKNVYLWFMAAKRNVPTNDPPPHIKRPHDLFEVVKSITTESFI